MKKMWVILKREYITRVKNKTFIIMTILTPLLFIGVYLIAILIALSQNENDVYKNVLLYTPNHQFEKQPDTIANFVFKNTANYNEALTTVKTDKAYALLSIEDANWLKMDSVQWISKKNLSLEQKQNLESKLVAAIHKSNLSKEGIDIQIIEKTKPKLTISSKEIGDDGELKSNESSVKTIIAFVLVFIIYMFIFIYGTMIMRSVMEEKTNRIVEVLVSSVKPFHLMLGKILGVALTGLTQIALWIIFGTILSVIIIPIIGLKTGAHAAVPTGTMNGQIQKSAEMVQNSDVGNLLDTLVNLPFGQIIFSFIVFFVFGYLLYSSLFAAIGSAVNQETDSQQFVFPVTLPLIFSIIVAQTTVFTNPHGTISKILSYFPLTSPVIMPMRVPFGVAWYELLISTAILILSFLFVVYIAGRIYRVGILMYGKKPTWGQLFKWIFVKD